MIKDNPEKEINHNDDTPPVGSWGKIYFFVLLNLVLMIILFYYFTKVFE
jgi:hypothetical protein